MSKYSDGGDFEVAPSGSHVGRIYSIVDIGNQEYTDPQGKTKNPRKIIYSFELCNEKMEDGRSFVVSKFYTASLHDKATLTIDLNSLRGKKMTATDKENFSDTKLLNLPCMINVQINDKGKAVVGSLSPLPKGMTAPELTLDQIHFDLDAQNAAMLDKVPEWMQNLINWESAPTPEVKTPAAANIPEDDEVPF